MVIVANKASAERYINKPPHLPIVLHLGPSEEKSP
jgi:hypothetical protein